MIGWIVPDDDDDDIIMIDYCYYDYKDYENDIVLVHRNLGY